MGDTLLFRYGTNEHLRLLLRTDRGQGAERAVRTCVKPGDKVFDAGTGSGLLSYFALKAGAEKVVAVDNEDLDLARQVAADNGCGDRIDFRDADLLSVDLAGFGGPFDVILGFMFTNHILRDEERAKCVSRIARTLGKPGTGIVPSTIRYSARLVEWQALNVMSYRQDVQAARSQLKATYGIDFKAVTDRALEEIPFEIACPNYHRHYRWQPGEASAAARFERGQFRVLSDTVAFASVELEKCWNQETLYPETLTARTFLSGTLDGVIWQQELVYDELIIWTTETYSPLLLPVGLPVGETVVLDTGHAWRADHYLRRLT